MNLDNKILTIKGNDYLIIEYVEYENKKYVYLVNKTDELDTMFVEVAMNEGMKICIIDKDLFREKIYPLFIEKFNKNKQ